MNHIKTEEILEVLPVVLESGKVSNLVRDGSLSVSNLVKYGNLSQSNLDMILNEHVKKYKKTEKLLSDLKDVGRMACKMTDGSVKQDLINVIRNNRPVLKLDLAAGKKAMRRTSVQRWVVATATHLLEDMFWSYDKNVTPELLKNSKRRWVYTEEMRIAFRDMVQKIAATHYKPPVLKQCSGLTFQQYCIGIQKFDIPEDMSNVLDYWFTGKAIILTGWTAADIPILLSLRCSFDINGRVLGLPEGTEWKVLMFQPTSKTVTENLKPAKSKKPDTADKTVTDNTGKTDNASTYA